MNRSDVFFPLLLFTFFLWFGLSSYVVLNRLLHDLRIRSLRRLQTQLNALSTDAGPAERHYVVHRVLRWFPRTLVYRITVDVSMTNQVSEALSAYILARWGLARVRKQASTHRSRFDRWRRISALRVLTQMGSTDIHELLAKAVAEKSQDIIESAIILLGKLQDRRAAEILILTLRRARNGFSHIATQLDHFKIPIVDLLQPLLADRLPHVRYCAVSLVARYRGIEGLDRQIASLAGDPEPSVRKAVVDTLEKIGAPQAVPVALKLLTDHVGIVRAHAARALGRLSRGEIASSVTPLLADQEGLVRLAATESLIAMGHGVWYDVTAQLESPDAFARDGAATVLRELKMLDTRATGRDLLTMRQPDRIRTVQ